MLSVGWLLVPWKLLPVLAESRQAQANSSVHSNNYVDLYVLSPPHLGVIRRGWMAELARSVPVPALIVVYLTEQKIAGAGQMWGGGYKDLGVGGMHTSRLLYD